MPRPARPSRVAVALTLACAALGGGTAPAAGASLRDGAVGATRAAEVAVGAAAVPGVATPTGARPVAAAAAVPTSDGADRARADELRRVARDALVTDDGGDPDLDGSLLGIDGVAWRVALALLIALAVVVAVALARRGPRRRRGRVAADPDAGDALRDLEREAERAEQAGRHRDAVVLWFRAGARRLGAAGRLDPAARAPSTATATQVAQASGDPRVLALAVRHDRAAYGPDPVGPDDSRAAREGWRDVVAGPAVPPPDGEVR